MAKVIVHRLNSRTFLLLSLFIIIDWKLAFSFPQNPRFKCTNCGICCGDTKEKTRHILLLKTEVKQIAKKTTKTLPEFAVIVEGKQPYCYEMRKVNAQCVFLKDKRCGIYLFRPLICRFYPFQLSFNDDSQKYVFEFTLECPGLKSGQILSKADFMELFGLAQERLKLNYT